MQIPSSIGLLMIVGLTIAILAQKRNRQSLQFRLAYLNIRFNPQTGAKFSQIMQHYKAGKTSEALADTEKLQTITPNNLTLLYVLSSLYISTSQYAKALTVLNNLIDERGIQSNAVLFLNRGVAYARLHQYEQAFADYEHTLALNPNAAGVHNNIAWALSAMGHYEEALMKAEKALELDPTKSHFHGTHGQALWLLGDYDGAYKAFIRAQENRDIPQGYLTEQSAALYKLGAVNEAVGNWRELQTLKDAPHTAESLQKTYGFAPPFYEVLQEIERLASDE